MPKNPHADFTPSLEGYTGQGAFRFWCQMALPLTYDDSLSYYELLNKVVTYLNNTISDVANVETNVGRLAEAYNQLQDYVNNYFDDLDVEAELRNVLDKMVLDGTMDELLEPLVEENLPELVESKIDDVVADQIDGVVSKQIDDVVAEQLPALADENIPVAVTDWLEENVNPVGSAVTVDSTLTISGSAADAKVVGDNIKNLKNGIANLEHIEAVEKGMVLGSYISGTTGKPVNGYKYCRSGLIDTNNIKAVSIDGNNYRAFISYYDENGTLENVDENGYIGYGFTFTDIQFIPDYAKKIVISVRKNNDETNMTAEEMADVDEKVSLLFYTDKSLTKENIPADSKTVGDKIENLKDGIFDGLYKINYGELVFQSFISSTTGKPATAYKYVRTELLDRKSIKGIKLDDENYQYYISYYDENGTLEDVEDNGYIGNSGTVYGSIYIPENVEKIVVNVRQRYTEDYITRQVMADIASKLYIYAYTDKTLTRNNVAADAKSVGDEIQILKDNVFVEEKWGKDFINGQLIVISTGKIGYLLSYCRTEISKNNANAVSLTNNAYQYSIAFYDENADISTPAGFINATEYKNGLTWIPKNCIYFVISLRRSDGERFTDSDFETLKNDIKIYKVTDENNNLNKPADGYYTENAIGGLEYAAGVKYFKVNSGFYINISDNAVIDTDDKIANKNAEYTVGNCEQGDLIYIDAHGENSGKAYAFIDAEGNVIERATVQTLEGKSFITPSGATQIIVNSFNYPLKAYKNVPVAKRIFEKNHSLMNLEHGLISTTQNPGKLIDSSTNYTYFDKYMRTPNILDVSECNTVMVENEYSEIRIYEYDKNYGYVDVIYTVPNTPINIKSGIKYLRFVVRNISEGSSVKIDKVFDVLHVVTDGNSKVLYSPDEFNGNSICMCFAIKNRSSYGTIIDSTALLKLPPNYSPDGVPVPLMIYMHGTSGYRTKWQSVLRAWSGNDDLGYQIFDYIKNEGYAVLDVFGYASDNEYVDDANAFPYGSPEQIECINNAVNRVFSVYNIDKNGVYIDGLSAGGVPAITAAMHNVIPVKCCALQAPTISVLKGFMGRNAGCRKTWASSAGFVGDIDLLDGRGTNPDATIAPAVTPELLAYLGNNIDKIIGFNPMWDGILDIPQSTLTEWALTPMPDNLHLGAGESVESNWENKHRLCHHPIKLWVANDDENISPSLCHSFIKTLRNTNSYAEERIIPDGEGGHHAFAGSGSAEKISGTTSLGYEFSGIPYPWVELVEYFKKF